MASEMELSESEIRDLVAGIGIRAEEDRIDIETAEVETIQAALRIQRERIVAELREEAKGLRRITWGKSVADYEAELFEKFADRLEKP